MKKLGLKLEERFSKLGYIVEYEDYRLLDEYVFIGNGMKVLGYSFVLKKDDELCRFIICNTTGGKYSITYIHKVGDRNCVVEFHKIFSTYTKEYIKDLKGTFSNDDLLEEVYNVLIDYINLDDELSDDIDDLAYINDLYYEYYYNITLNDNNRVLMDYKNDIVSDSKPYYPRLAIFDLQLRFIPDFYDVILGGLYINEYKSSDIIRNILIINDWISGISITYNSVYNVFNLRVIDSRTRSEKLVNHYTLDKNSIISMVDEILDILKDSHLSDRTFVGNTDDIKEFLDFNRPIIKEELLVFFNMVSAIMNQLDAILTYNNSVIVRANLTPGVSNIYIDKNDSSIAIQAKEVYNNSVLLSVFSEKDNSAVIMNMDTLDINKGELFKRLSDSIIYIINTSFYDLNDERFDDLKIHIIKIIELLLKDRMTYRKGKSDLGLLRIFDDSVRAINSYDDDNKAKSLYKYVNKLYAINTSTMYAFNISINDNNFIITKKNLDFNLYQLFNSEEYSKYDDNQILEELNKLSTDISVFDLPKNFMYDSPKPIYPFDDIPKKIILLMRLINYRDIISYNDIVMSIFYHNSILKQINNMIDEYHMIDVTSEGSDKNVDESKDNND